MDPKSELLLYCPVQALIPVQAPTPSFVVFEVLNETAHHAKFLCRESNVDPLSTHTPSCDHSDALQVPQHPAAKFRTHASV